MEEEKEDLIYFPHKEKLENYLNEITKIVNDISLKDKNFNLVNLKEAKDTEKKLLRIITLANQIRLGLSIKVKNPSKDIDEFITVPKTNFF